MEVLNYFRQLFKDKTAIATQISLFSLAGIFVLLFIKYTASWGNLFYSEDFYIVPPESNFELWVYLFVGTVLSIYFTGFCVNLIRNVLTSKSPEFPEITLRPFVYFIKSLPYGLYLCVCYFVLFVGGVLLLVKTGIAGLYYTFAAIMVCLIPFVMMMFIQFVQTMTFTKKNLNIFNVFKILEFTLGEVIFFSLRLFVRLLIPLIVSCALLLWKIPKDFFIPVLPFKLGVLTVLIYLLLVYVFVYLIGLANIFKDKVKL
ncbi:MAG: hypothetical protein NC191_01370 [Muribaculaceae bacterium]|nr:hypothetical protein [Muribaculaceae bacterium]